MGAIKAIKNRAISQLNVEILKSFNLAGIASPVDLFT